MPHNSVDMLQRDGESHAAGVGFGELALDELREDRTAAQQSSGYFCTLTLECNC